MLSRWLGNRTQQKGCSPAVPLTVVSVATMSHSKLEAEDIISTQAATVLPSVTVYEACSRATTTTVRGIDASKYTATASSLRSLPLVVVYYIITYAHGHTHNLIPSSSKRVTETFAGVPTVTSGAESIDTVKSCSPSKDVSSIVLIDTHADVSATVLVLKMTWNGSGKT